MTLYEFNTLQENDKYHTTWNLGIYLDSVNENYLKINLYAIGKFFVEVLHDPKSNKISGIRSFKSGHRLDKYSGTISP